MVTIKQGYITRNKRQTGIDDKDLTIVELRAQNSEQPTIDASRRRKADILPKLPNSTQLTMTTVSDSTTANKLTTTAGNKVVSPNYKGSSTTATNV